MEGMTEQEAAEKLCELLNKIEAAGHAVQLDLDMLTVGDGSVYLTEPPCEDEPWEVRGV